VSNTLTIITAATQILHAMRFEAPGRQEEILQKTARALDSELRFGGELDEMFVPITVWDMTRGRISYAYDSVKPAHSPQIHRIVAAATNPYDLVALDANGWIAPNPHDIAYTNTIEGVPYRLAFNGTLWSLYALDGDMPRLVSTHDIACDALTDFIMRDIDMAA